MTRYYVYSGKFNIQTGKAPKIRDFTSSAKARAYAIQVMNRLGEKAWTVFSDSKCTRPAYEIEKRKNYYNAWDLKTNRDVIVHKDGTLIQPDYVTGKPYWGQGKKKQLKTYYLQEADGFKWKIMATDAVDLRKKILAKELPKGHYYAYRNEYLIGSVLVKGPHSKYWSSFSSKAGWSSMEEITPSGLTRQDIRSRGL